jgi:magnesium transporter
MRPETPFIMPETRTYLRDCFDHAVAVLDLVESYREMTNGLMEVYLMQANNRMSEVMKTMAVITVFFLPLTFLTGLYGMNFDRGAGNMPELGWQYGYLWFWFWVAAVVSGIFLWVKRKRWL